MARKLRSSQRLKHEIVKVVGKIPDRRSDAELISVMSRVDRYLLADVIFLRGLRRGILLRSEYLTLEKENADRCGLPANSLFRERLNPQ